MGLSVLKIVAAKPSAKAYKLFDEKGLFLLITPNGSKHWRFKCRFGGKEKLLSLGSYENVSLAAAREQRDGLCRLVQSKIEHLGQFKRVKTSPATTLSRV